MRVIETARDIARQYFDKQSLGWRREWPLCFAKIQFACNFSTMPYVVASSRPGRMRAGWAYFVAFPQAAKDFAELSRAKLTMPVLAIGDDKATGVVLGQQ